MYTYNGSESQILSAFTGQYEIRTRPNTSSSWSVWTPSGIHGTVLTEHSSIKSWSGVKTPDYEGMKRRGQLIPLTAWQKVTDTWQVPQSSFTANANLTQVRGNGHLAYGGTQALLPPFITVDDLDVAALKARLMLSAADEVYHNGHDTFTFFAEIAKTFALFKSLAPRISQIFETLEAVLAKGAVRNKNGKRVQATSRLALYNALLNTPGLWLEARYGLRPLVYDIEEIAKATAELQYGFMSPIKTSKQVDQPVHSKSSFEQTITTGVYGSVKATTVFSYECGLRANIAARIRTQGFGGSPIMTAYELIPLSFVLDWFLDLGSWLGAIHFAVMESEYSAAYGYYLKETQTTTYSRLTTANGWTVSGGLTTFTRSRETLMRVPATVPLLPAFSVNLNAGKEFDLGAILFQIFAGKAKLFKMLTG